MALDTYLTLTRQLLQNPPAPVALYTDALLIPYINQARVQLAGESQSIKILGSTALVLSNIGPYPFSGITVPGAGVGGVENVRILRYVKTGGQAPIRSRPWPWFQQYHLYDPTLRTGAPEAWSQYGEGVNGTFYVSPLPDATYQIRADCICFPINLVDDTTPEAIPAEWTTAIPYYAAYLALLSSQTGARMEEAQRMFQLYQQFMATARKIATPDVLSAQYPQNPQPVRPIEQPGAR